MLENTLMMKKANPDNVIKLEVVEDRRTVSTVSRKELIKFACAVLGLAVVLILSAVLAISLQKTVVPISRFVDEETVASVKHDLITIGNYKELWSFSLESERFVLIKSIEGQIRTFDVVSEELIFWSEKDVPSIKSSSKEHPDVSHTKKWKPQAIAIDHITGNIYIIDKATGTLNVMDKNGENYNVVLSDLEKPHDLVLDIQNRLLFIIQESKSILRANMDGTRLTTIIEDSGIDLITLDSVSKRIFWTRNHEIMSWIMSSDYNGEGCNILFEDVEFHWPLTGLAFIRDKLYWTLSSLVDLESMLWSCQIHNNKCTNHLHKKIPFDEPKILKAVEQDNIEEVIDNPCKVNNGGCTDLCLLTVNGSRSCACKSGWQLNVDQTSCSIITDYILFTVGNIVKGQIFDSKENDTFVDAILPTELLIEQDSIHFDYSLENNDFYFSDAHTIYKLNLANHEEQKSLLHVGSNHTVTGIAIDWVSHNLYYIKRANHFWDFHSIMIVNLNNFSYQKSVKDFYDRGYDSCPQSIMIHPIMGKLYFLYIYDDSWNSYIGSHIGYTSLRGSYIINKKIRNVNKVISAIDYEENDMYIIDVGYTEWHLNLSTDTMLEDNKLIDIENIISIYAYKSYIFVSNSKGIFRLDKLTKSNSTKVYPRSRFDSNHKISGVKIFSPSIQTIDDQDRCEIGDCQELCFARPTKTCGYIGKHHLG